MEIIGILMIAMLFIGLVLILLSGCVHDTILNSYCLNTTPADICTETAAIKYDCLCADEPIDPEC